MKTLHPGLKSANLRSVHIDKIRRDAEKFRKHAAGLIVLNHSGKVIDVITRSPFDPQVIRIIAVLAPAVISGEDIAEVLVFEMGFSRSRPYRQVERYKNGVLDLFIKSRTPVRSLSLSEYLHVAPRLLLIMREMIFAVRERWKVKEAWEVGPKQVTYERGVFFSIARKDTHALTHFLLEDLCFRKKEYIPSHTRILKSFLRGRIQSGSFISDSQLRKMKFFEKTVQHLGIIRLHPVYVREMHRLFNNAQWEFLQRIASLSQIELLEVDGDTILLDQMSAITFPSVEGVCFIAKYKERKRQACGCFVIEAFFEKEYREKNEIPF